MNNNISQMIQCEHQYMKEFCVTEENQDIIRFRDYSLMEMRDYNFTYIKNKNNLKEIMEYEIKRKEKAEFVKFVLDLEDDELKLPDLDYNVNISKIAYYSFDISKLANFKQKVSPKKAMIKKVKQAEMIQDILSCDFKQVSFYKEFHQTKNIRRGQVYLADNDLNCYVCYEHNEPIGICDLFTWNGIAKIENFLVIPECQRKGYGSYILDKLIETALEKKSEFIYLITDEDDTAKEMYEKLYFDKVSRRLDLVIDLKSDRNIE